MVSKKKIQQEYEMHFFEILFCIWKNKLKIILFIFVTILFAYIFLINPKKNAPIKYDITVNINPISFSDELKYYYFNKILDDYLTLDTNKNYLNLEKINFDYFEKKLYLNKENLYQLFIEILKDKDFFRDILYKFGYLKIENDKDKILYNENLDKLISSIQIKKSNEYYNLSWNIDSSLIDKILLEEFILYLEKNVNNKIRDYIIDNTEIFLKSEKDIVKISLEKIKANQSRLIKDHKFYIENQLIFLQEQALLARKLNLKYSISDNIVGEKFLEHLITEKYYFDNYYLRGYEAIENEIETIKNRSNITPFIKDYEVLNSKKNQIIESQNIQYLENEFKKLFGLNSNEFYAANVDLSSINYTLVNSSKYSNKSILLLAFLIGLMLGVSYVLIIDAVNKYQKYN